MAVPIDYRNIFAQQQSLQSLGSGLQAATNLGGFGITSYPLGFQARVEPQEEEKPSLLLLLEDV